jgi:hypothetical protein
LKEPSINFKRPLKGHWKVFKRAFKGCLLLKSQLQGLFKGCLLLKRPFKGCHVKRPSKEL